MIGAYLNSLYANCPSLSKTPAYTSGETVLFFEGQVSQVLKTLQLGSEAELISFLIARPYRDLIPVFTGSAYLEIFYLVNSLGEYAPSAESRDELRRFRLIGSAQTQTGITENRVWKLLRATVETDAYLAARFTISSQKSYFFLSHDIDSLYGSLLQDGMWALKKRRFDVLLKLFADTLMAKPHWFNIDLIMKLESEHDFKSTFYWLVNQGKVDKRQTNSDYDISSDKLKHTFETVTEKGFENGLHKSISTETLAAELNKLPVKVKGNRYHYLKFQVPQGYQDIEKAGLQLDASLGFAEHYGFRNNYGYPFSPYNIQTGAAYSFLEVPLNVMDGTFQRYMRVPVNKTSDTIIDFFEKNSQDCLLSVLWHNTFFTDYKYKGYRAEYIKLLQYLHENQFRNINQSGIINLFSWKK